MTENKELKKSRFKHVWEILKVVKKYEVTFLSLKDEESKRILTDSIIIEVSIIMYGADRSCGTASGAAFAIVDFFKAFDIQINGGYAWGIDIETQNTSGPAVIFGGNFLGSLFKSLLRNELSNIITNDLHIEPEFIDFIAERIRSIINDAENIGRMMII